LNPADSPLQNRYSYTWANAVFEQLHKKYARATDFLLKYLEITPRQWASFLAKGDPMWVYLRDAVHFVEEHGSDRKWDSDTIRMCGNFWEYLRRKPNFRVKNHLDSLRKKLDH